MRGLFVFLALLVGLSGVGQDMYWIKAMSDPNANYFKACESFNRYWQGKEKTPHSGYKQFERWREHIEPYVNADGSIQKYADVWQTAVDYHRNQNSRSANGNWKEVGPWTEKNYSRGVGRLTCIAFHPTDTNTFYVGSPSGGIWITHDNGKTWYNPKDDIMNFGVSAIVVDHSNPDVIYIGTGDSDGLDTDGTGVYKSEDGGKTWTRKSLGMNDKTVTKLIMDPDSANIILAATREGLYKTTNNATSWYPTWSAGDFRDLEFKPGDPNRVYASQWTYPGVGAWIYVSEDKGDSWTRKFITDGLFPDMRQEIEVSPASPDKLYAVGEKYLFVSENSGDSFQLVIDSGNFLIHRDRQGWYNASFEIDPDNPNIMYCGNVRLYKSYDAGLTWIRLNHTHADNHYIEIHPITKALFVLDDGGIHRSYDGGNTFEDLTNLGVAAIYRIAQSPFNSEHTLQGYQDCGSKYYDGYNWTSVYGADGMQPLYDKTDSMIFYTGYQYGGIVRHLKHIGSAQVIEKPNDEGGWITPYCLDATDNRVMYQGRENAWKSTNIHTKDRKDVTWKNISNGPAANVGRYIRLEQQRGVPKRMFAIVQNSNRSQSKLIKCDDIYDTNYVWTQVNLSTAPLIADVETNPHDSNQVWAVIGGNVFQSDNVGQSFTNIRYNLPAVPHHVIVLDTHTQNLYLGSDAGVFVLPQGDTNWVSFNSGLGHSARVRDLAIYYDSTDHNKSMLKAATYGRGLWESDLYGSGSMQVKPSAAFIQSEEPNHTFSINFYVEISFKRHLEVDSMVGFDASDIKITNGIIRSFGSVGKKYQVQILAQNHGKVYVDVPQGVATSAHSGLPNDSAQTFVIDYLPLPNSIGPDGPGGVGDTSSLILWLKGDNVMTNANGDTITQDGEKIENWYDVAGRGFFATQGVDSSKPFFRLDSNGIAGWPAVEYRPPNRFLMVRDFGPVGTDITVFAVAKSNTPNWTGHSWIANSRERNGFLFHNSNNAKSIYGNVLDRDKRYLGTPSVDWPDVESPHVYAIQYNERMWKNHIYLDHRVGIDYIDRDRYRDGSDSISIRLGKDFRDRYGDGKLGEMIYYKEDIGNTRRILVSNYLASKYQIDLNVEKRFDFDAEFKYDVAGIGRTSDLDFHEAAKSYPLFIVSPQNQKNGNYLMWGHNNAPLRWDSVKTGNGLLMKRYWKVSETGDYGSVTLRVDTHALNNAQKEIALRIGTLSEIKNNTGGRTIVLSPNRDYFEASVDFENGEYFTFITSDDLFSGVESFASLNRARLVPNPAINGLSELVFHAESSGEFQMNVMDNSGRILIARTGVSGSGTNRVDIDLSGYASGIYLIILQSENQKTVLKQIR